MPCARLHSRSASAATSAAPRVPSLRSSSTSGNHGADGGHHAAVQDPPASTGDPRSRRQESGSSSSPPSPLRPALMPATRVATSSPGHQGGRRCERARPVVRRRRLRPLSPYSRKIFLSFAHLRSQTYSALCENPANRRAKLRLFQPSVRANAVPCRSAAGRVATRGATPASPADAHIALSDHREATCHPPTLSLSDHKAPRSSTRSRGALRVPWPHAPSSQSIPSSCEVATLAAQESAVPHRPPLGKEHPKPPSGAWRCRGGDELVCSPWHTACRPRGRHHPASIGSEARTTRPWNSSDPPRSSARDGRHIRRSAH